ncbi:MAG: hypothetical protein LBI29_00550 [Rickettsiales bacterium]|jgi:hypothetical protein|nr:hypothetical protein [Rickettsiales bacterium]
MCVEGIKCVHCESERINMSGIVDGGNRGIIAETMEEQCISCPCVLRWFKKFARTVKK